MKQVRNILLAAALAFGICSVTVTPAAGAVSAKAVFAGGGTDVSTNLCYAIVSAFSRNGGTPLITYLDATSDLTTSIVQFYLVSNTTGSGYTNSTTTVYVNNTNGFAANDIVIIQHTLTDTYERRVVSSVAATNLVLTVAPTTTVVPGDTVYRCTTNNAGYIPCGNTTITKTGSGIYAGQAGLPLLLEVNGTSSCQINAVCASYIP